MSHTFLSIDMNLIPQATKDSVPNFWKGLFSNDKSRMIIDGKNIHGELVHTQKTLSAWLQWSGNPQELTTQLLSTAIEYTRKELELERANVNSIWYRGEDNNDD